MSKIGQYVVIIIDEAVSPNWWGIIDYLNEVDKSGESVSLQEFASDLDVVLDRVTTDFIIDSRMIAFVPARSLSEDLLSETNGFIGIINKQTDNASTPTLLALLIMEKSNSHQGLNNALIKVRGQYLNTVTNNVSNIQ